MTTLLAAEALHKSFGAQRALEDVSIELVAGELHAIVGENGAGKSTLARILTGSLRPDTGRLRRAGAAVTFDAPGEALAAGVGYVPQQPALVATLSLVDNYLLGDAGWAAARRDARARLRRAMSTLGVELPLERPSGALDVVQRQLGDLAVALARGANVLVLDEPTSALGPVEVERLNAALRRLTAAGSAVALVTHRIVEVLGHCGRVTVLRQGRVVHSGATRGMTAAELGHWMVGGRGTVNIAAQLAPDAAAPAPAEPRVRLEVRDVQVGGATDGVLRGVAFDLAAGERVGIAGVGGAGQAALAAVIAGLLHPHRGSVQVDGHAITGRPGRARAAGLAYIPEDRAAGLSFAHTVAENLAFYRLRSLSTRLGLRDRRAERAHAAPLVAGYGVAPPDAGARLATFSGGNQQKLLLARELEGEPAVIVAHGPTRGLDRAAAATVSAALFAAAGRGAAVLVLSSDLDELFALCSRLLVLAAGQLVAEFDCRSRPPDPALLGRALAGSAA